MEAKIIKTDGQEEITNPKNGKDFQLDELQAIVGGYIEVVYLPNNRIMILNEEGKLDKLPLNQKATEVFQKAHGPHDVIVGPVLICNQTQIK